MVPTSSFIHALSTEELELLQEPPRHAGTNDSCERSFAQDLYRLLCLIPAGRVTTYGELARAVGSRAYRAVGKILHRNPNAPVVPCHRVVMSSGKVGGYAFGVKKKIELLRKEGVQIQDDTVLDFNERLFRYSLELRNLLNDPLR